MSLMLYSENKGFTLVELIVVITILAILATIGFVSYQGYTLSARESARVNDIRVIEKGLNIYATRNGVVPLPDQSVTLTASGEVIGYQGAAGIGVLTALTQAQKIKDPLDNEFYSYFVSSDRLSIQMLAMMESPSSLSFINNSQALANSDYSVRFPKLFGKSLGILTHQDNTPLYLTGGLTTLDVVNYSGTDYYTAHFSAERSVTGTGGVLWQLPVNANCSRIKETTNNNSGVYEVNPKNRGSMQVYCEMNMDNGGWALISRSTKEGSGDFGWFTQTGSLEDNSNPYSLGSNWQNIPFTEILLTGYDSGKNPSGFSYVINKTGEQLATLTSTAPVSTCRNIERFEGRITDVGSSDNFVNCDAFDRFGYINNTTGFKFSENGGNGTNSLRSDGIFMHHSYQGRDFWNSYRLAGAYAGEGNTKVQGMLFVR